MLSIIIPFFNEEKNLEEGKGSPVFRSGEEAVKWLEEQGI